MAAILLAAPGSASAQTAPPENDNYLESAPVNDPGSRLPRRSTVRLRGDNSGATVQSDIFSPCGVAQCPQGPPEPTTCEVDGGSRPYAKTVWYDFYPDRAALARIQVNALFDPIIGIFEFDRRTGAPRGEAACIDRLDFTNEELEVPVLRGRAYTVQVGVHTGGFEPAGGRFEALFDFLRLPRVGANPTLRARPTSTGIRVTSLRLRADRGARASLSCTRRACRAERRTVRGTISFRNLRNKRLRAGARIRIRVTMEDEVGRYFEYRVTRGNIRRIERCLEPGSSRPRRSCT
ncbi:MAG: hypothetical protein WD844_17600 [Thermoleophilaceae bacterium]